MRHCKENVCQGGRGNRASTSDRTTSDGLRYMSLECRYEKWGQKKNTWKYKNRKFPNFGKEYSKELNKSQAGGTVH